MDCLRSMGFEEEIWTNFGNDITWNGYFGFTFSFSDDIAGYNAVLGDGCDGLNLKDDDDSGDLLIYNFSKWG